MSVETVAPAVAAATVSAAAGRTLSAAAQVAAVAALSEAQAAARLRLLTNATTYLVRLLSAFRGWYDEDAVAGFAEKADATIRSTQQASADLTTSYQVQMLARLGVGLSRAEQARARFVVPGPSEPNLRGVDFLTEWERPAEQYRYARSQGEGEDAAFEKAVERLKRLAEADETLAMRRATRRVLQVAAGQDPDDDPPLDLEDPDRLDGRDEDALDAVAERERQSSGGGSASGAPPSAQTRVKVIGHRRVLHPELTKSGPCGLCVVASDRWYSVEELQPMHDHCECTVAPIVLRDGKLEDPGRKVNQADLERIYEAAGSTGADDLRRTRVRVDEHGELGPVLVVRPASSSASAKPRLQRGALPGESELDEARRRLGYLENEVANLKRLVDQGESRFVPTLRLRERALTQHRARVVRLQARPAA